MPGKKEHHPLLPSSFHFPLGTATGSVPGNCCHSQHAMRHLSLNENVFAKWTIALIHLN